MLGTQQSSRPVEIPVVMELRDKWHLNGYTLRLAWATQNWRLGFQQDFWDSVSTVSWSYSLHAISFYLYLHQERDKITTIHISVPI